MPWSSNKFHLTDVAAAFAAANRIREMRPTSQDEIDPATEDFPFDTEKSSGMNIELRNVSFKYPTRDVAVLKNLNMIVSGPGIFLKNPVLT